MATGPSLVLVEPPEPDALAAPAAPALEPPAPQAPPQPILAPQPESPAPLQPAPLQPASEVASAPTQSVQEAPSVAEPERIEAVPSALEEDQPAPAPPMEPAPDAPVRLDQAQWEAFVEEIRQEAAPLAASLDHSQVVRCDQGVLTLGFRVGALTATQVEDARRRVLERLRERVGPFKELKLETLEQLEHSPFQRREIRTAEEEADRRHQLSNHPSVQAFVTRFDGELRRVMTEREAGGGS